MEQKARAAQGKQSKKLLTRNFVLGTLELVKCLHKPAGLEHGFLNNHSLAIGTSGVCWHNGKGSDSNIHHLKTQARRGINGSAGQSCKGAA